MGLLHSVEKVEARITKKVKVEIHFDKIKITLERAYPTFSMKGESFEQSTYPLSDLLLTIQF